MTTLAALRQQTGSDCQRVLSHTRGNRNRLLNFFIIMPTPIISAQQAQREWEQYPLIDPTDIEFVAYTAHVETALRIIEDKNIRAGLVYDDSRLKRYRTVVTWFSPNVWAPGSRYGNIAFKVPFEQLYSDFPKTYWVETAEYAVAAPRIFFSTTENKRLIAYDPDSDDGPWKQSPRHGHQRNGDICLEILVEGDVKYADVTEIEFYTHHPTYCSERRSKGRQCRNVGDRRAKAGGQFMCGLIGRKLSLGQVPVHKGSTEDAWSWVANKLTGYTADANASLSASSRRALVRSLMNLIYLEDEAGAASLARLFRSTEQLVETAREVLQAQFTQVPDTDD